MKKTYFAPQVQVIFFQAEGLMNGSLTMDGRSSQKVDREEEIYTNKLEDFGDKWSDE